MGPEAVTRALALAGWAAVAAALLVCPLLARIRSLGLAGLRELIAMLVATRWRRAAVVIGWMWVGWHFFVR